MCSDFAISIQNIEKQYQIYKKPRDRLLQMFSWGKRQHFVDFWALREISLDISRGETVGILGRNGSGKSTLLQIICGTLNPTGGTVSTQGRIAALLELGSGFNPEFTGRENVYLNAAILGLNKPQIDERFGEIASFADIGDFIDQPVKTYSSGMMVRLAFSVIAHVDADIMVIDEALAVGDAVFTQKCMRFIRAFQKRGTLLFVSHDTSTIVNLCSRALWIDSGRIILSGNPRDVSEAYLKHTLQSVYGADTTLESVDQDGAQLSAESGRIASSAELDTPSPTVSYGGQMEVMNNLAGARGFRSGLAELVGVEIENLSAPAAAVFCGGERVRVTLRALAHEPLPKPILGFAFFDRLGQVLFGENTLPFTALNPRTVGRGCSFFAEFVFRLPMLPNGDYVVFASVANGELHDNTQHHLLHDALVVKVSSSKVRWGLMGIPYEQVSLESAT